MQETIIRRWERLNKLNKTFKEEKPSVVFQVILQGGPAFFQHFPGGSDSKGSACSEGNRGWISGLERSPGGGHGNPLQYSCLENPMDGEPGEPRSLGSQRVRHDLSTKHN